MSGFPIDSANRFVTGQSGEGPEADGIRASARAASAAAAVVTTGGPVTWSYVATNGTAGGQRGNMDAPFDTVQHAFDAILAANSGLRETIWVAPGTYLGNLFIPGTFAPGITIRGSRGGALLLGNPGSGVIVYGTFTSASCEIELQDLNVISDPGSRAIDMGSNDTGYAGIFRMRNCAIQGQTRLSKLNTIDISDSTTSTDIVDIRDCGGVSVRDTDIKNGLTVSWTHASAGAPRSPQSFYGCSISDGSNAFSLQINGSPFLIIDTSTQIFTGTTAIDGHLGNEIGFGTNVTIEAKVTGPANFVFAPTTDAGTINSLSLCRSEFLGAVTITQSAGAASSRNVVDARGAIFKSTIASPTNTDIDLRNAQYTQASLTVAGTGTADRNRWEMPGQAIAGGGGDTVVTIVPPFPAGGTYVAMVTPASAAGLQPAVGTYLPGSFHITPASAAALTVDISIQRS